jgi:mannose-6-phosphate isomerase
MFTLKGKVQHYAWGGYTYLPQLLGIKNTQQKPYSEYWLGAHGSNAALVELDNGNTTPLNILIEEDKNKWLGKTVAKQFGGLPYLFKVLDVKDMLSIQVHPTKKEAEKGYAKENEAGIPITASYRNYKDDNHKPEVMVALSEFWLLHGFKEKTLLQQTLNEVSEFKNLLPIFDKEGYFGLYKHVMELPQKEVDDTLSPLLKKYEPAYKANQLSKTTPAYWACKTLADSDDKYSNIDRGIFSIYFFNILQLHPGQAVFQGAGVPHAYLEGQNIELMANSDNVLRGGLTPKHIDVPELLKHTMFEGIVANIMNGEKKGTETMYDCPVTDFIVSKIELTKNENYMHTAFSIDIVLVLSGRATITGNNKTIHLLQGEAAIAQASESYIITTDTNVVLYKASVPFLQE